ncbi:MAG: DMT family transporter [Bacillota bacterium]|nr:DMT family transporter [Bacillota bacterium]
MEVLISKIFKSRYSRTAADCSLIFVTLIWGLTFVTVKNAIDYLPPHTFNFYRFTLATAFMLLFCWSRRQHMSKELLLKGGVIGIFLFAGYAFQTVGLKYTSASNAGFITGLAVVLVPVINAFMTKKLPAIPVILGVASATLGLAFLSLGDQFVLNMGDILVLFCAVSFALHIIFVGKYTFKFDTVLLVTVQIAVVAALSGLFALAEKSNQASFTNTKEVLMALLITAILATCLAFLIQNYMQKFTTATRTAIIFSMEPVFAALFAVVLLQEILSARAWWGGALVVLGMILSELKLKHIFKQNDPKQDIMG